MNARKPGDYGTTGVCQQRPAASTARQRLERAAHAGIPATAPAVWSAINPRYPGHPRSPRHLHRRRRLLRDRPTTSSRTSERNGFQIYVNGGTGSSVPNNATSTTLIHDVSKHGINLATNAQNGIVCSTRRVQRPVRGHSLQHHAAERRPRSTTTPSTPPTSAQHLLRLLTTTGTCGRRLSLENNIFCRPQHAYTGGSGGLPCSSAPSATTSSNAVPGPPSGGA